MAVKCSCQTPARRAFALAARTTENGSCDPCSPAKNPGPSPLVGQTRSARSSTRSSGGIPGRPPMERASSSWRSSPAIATSPQRTRQSSQGTARCPLPAISILSSCSFAFRLKEKFQCQLHQAPRLCFRNDSEVRRADIIVRQPGVDVIENIEEFRPEMQRLRLPELNILERGEIPLLES